MPSALKGYFRSVKISVTKALNEPSVSVLCASAEQEISKDRTVLIAYPSLRVFEARRVAGMYFFFFTSFSGGEQPCHLVLAQSGCGPG
jgi:hypothetical protein